MAGASPTPPHGETESSFLDEIALLIESSELTFADATSLADDLSLLPLNIEGGGDLFTELVESVNVKPEQKEPGEPPPPNRSTVCRNRQRAELEHLRHQVHELEEQLESLQHAKHSVSPASSSMSSDESHADASDVMAPTVVWEKIAKRQMSAKQKAEAENMKLREMLQGQLKIARGLERVLRKRSSLQMDVAALETKRRKRANSVDGAVYEQLQLSLDRRYREVDVAFQQNKLSTTWGDREDVRVLSSGDASVVSVEILYSKVLPFEFARTSEAVWNCTTKKHLQLTEGYYWAETIGSDQVRAKFEIPLTVRRQTVTLHAYVALKRYHESERQVYAWDSTSHVTVSNKTYEGIQLLDHGWTVVERLSGSDPANPATIVKSCSRIVPDEQSLPKQSPIGVLSDVLIASYHRNYATLYETVENELMCTVLR